MTVYLSNGRGNNSSPPGMHIYWGSGNNTPKTGALRSLGACTESSCLTHHFFLLSAESRFPKTFSHPLKALNPTAAKARHVQKQTKQTNPNSF